MTTGHLVLVIAVVVAALAFDFINGFHDAANSIATIVSTRVLTPLRAVLWAAFFNFIAFALFKLHVASPAVNADIPNTSVRRSGMLKIIEVLQGR
jgi:inorganic phosphate transporter, PiT family